MPELADVEGFRRVARQARGRRIDKVLVHDSGVLRGIAPEEFARRLTGLRIGTPARHGKWLILPLAEDAPVLLLHFGMTGSLHWSTSPGVTPRHRYDRVELVTDDGVLRYRDMRKLTGIRLALDRAEAARLLGHLGPDARTIAPCDLARRLRRGHRALKSALMDQRVVAGLGNLLVDEILWHAGLAPTRVTCELSEADLRRLVSARRAVLASAVRVGCVPGRRSWLTGNRNSAGRCPRDRTPLARGKVGGRTTFWCPRCQPG